MNKINCTILLFLILGVSLLFSCDVEKSVVKEISLERWAVSGDKDSYQKDSIVYLETKQYNENGIHHATLFYSPDKVLSAKEIRIFKDELGPVGSQYKSASDSLLSYYTIKSDKNGLVSETKAFDAQSDQLLRIESFSYDQRGHLLSKTIKNSMGNPVRFFRYVVDEHGNEMETTVLDGNEKVILTEIFQITKYDSNQKWTEKWGFVNDKPFSYVARKINYQ